jgi:hypothetical protein
MKHDFAHENEQRNGQKDERIQAAVHRGDELLQSEHPEKDVHSHNIDQHKTESDGHSCEHQYDKSAEYEKQDQWPFQGRALQPLGMNVVIVFPLGSIAERFPYLDMRVAPSQKLDEQQKHAKKNDRYQRKFW